MFGGRFVLLTGAQGAGWIDVVARLVPKARPDLVAYTVGGGELADPEGAWRTLYAVEADGAVIVRPDGYIGWRSRGGIDNPARALPQVLDNILGLA